MVRAKPLSSYIFCFFLQKSLIYKATKLNFAMYGMILVSSPASQQISLQLPDSIILSDANLIAFVSTKYITFWGSGRKNKYKHTKNRTCTDCCIWRTSTNCYIQHGRWAKEDSLMNL